MFIVAFSLRNLCVLCGSAVNRLFSPQRRRGRRDTQRIYNAESQIFREQSLGFNPTRPTLSSVKTAATGCRACDLWKKGTQTVFGEGSRRANVLFVGEQPGNEEDLTGKPFVGLAGRLFDNALESAGIDRKQTYVTNVVKHFKWEPRGKRRIHKKPNSTEIAACRPWLETEIALVKPPQVIVALGATAAQALLGPQFRVTKQRGEFIPSTLALYVMAIVHPSSILRAPDDETRQLELRRFIDDLKKLAKVIK